MKPYHTSDLEFMDITELAADEFNLYGLRVWKLPLNGWGGRM